MAPEMIQEQSYDEKVDIWSLGVLFYLLLTNIHPLQYLTDFVKKTEIKEAVLDILQSSNPESLIDFDNEIFSEMNSEIEFLLKKMLKIDSKERISANQILELQSILYSHYSEYCSLKKKSTLLRKNSSFKKNIYNNSEIEDVKIDSFEELVNIMSSKQKCSFRKHILEAFTVKLVNQDEIDELSTLFNSLDLSANNSIDQDNIELFYSVFAEGHCSNEEDESKFTECKGIMGTKEEYCQDDFIKSVVVFKNLMKPTKENWYKIFRMLDSQNKGYFTIRELKSYFEKTNHDCDDIAMYLSEGILDIKVELKQFISFNQL